MRCYSVNCDKDAIIINGHNLIIRDDHCFLIGVVRAASYEVVSNELPLLGRLGNSERRISNGQAKR